MGLREAEWEIVWVHVVWDRDQWRSAVNTVMKLWEFLTS